MRTDRIIVAVVLWICTAEASAVAGTIYVDATWGGPYQGTLSNPYLTITQALQQGSPGTGDEIVVKSGTYNTTLGESWPLRLPDGVDIKAYDSSSRPRIGGDTHLVTFTGSSDTGFVLVDASLQLG